MTTIDKLIYDALAARHSVTLPDGGMLEVRRRGARKISDTRIVPPQNVVVFVPGEEESTRSVVALVADDRSVGMDEAAAIYGTWLEVARRDDGTIAIEGVGETGGDEQGGFIVGPVLHNALNPMEEDVVTMETGRKSTPSWVWIVIAIILAALVAVGVMLCKRGAFGGATGGDNVGVVLPAPTTTTEPAPAPTSKPAEDPLASVEAARAAVTAAEAAAVASNERFHVIAGAFSIESNADNFIARLKREYPELTPRKIADASKGLYLVSIIQTATRREASGKMNLYRDLDLWIYEQ